MSDESVSFELAIDAPDITRSELDELRSGLAEELRSHGADSVKRVPAEAAAEGAKGDPFTIGGLVMVVVPMLIPKLLDIVSKYVSRKKIQTVKIRTAQGNEVEISSSENMSEDEMRKAAEALAGTPG